MVVRRLPSQLRGCDCLPLRMDAEIGGQLIAVELAQARVALDQFVEHALGFIPALPPVRPRDSPQFVHRRTARPWRARSAIGRQAGSNGARVTCI